MAQQGHHSVVALVALSAVRVRGVDGCLKPLNSDLKDKRQTSHGNDLALSLTGGSFFCCCFFSPSLALTHL